MSLGDKYRNIGGKAGGNVVVIAVYVGKRILKACLYCGEVRVRLCESGGNALHRRVDALVYSRRIVADLVQQFLRLLKGSCSVVAQLHGNAYEVSRGVCQAVCRIT